MRAAGGFTLLEVLVALVVVEVGLLAVIGTSLLARRVLTRAEMVERGVAEVERAYDSLVHGWTAGTDLRVGPSGWVRWVVSDAGHAQIDFGLQPDSSLVRVDALLPRGVSGR